MRRNMTAIYKSSFQNVKRNRKGYNGVGVFRKRTGLNFNPSRSDNRSKYLLGNVLSTELSSCRVCKLETFELRVGLVSYNTANYIELKVLLNSDLRYLGYIV